MPHPIAYLSLNGNCADAVRFYERVLGGKLEILMSGADSPMATQIPKESAHCILHARIADRSCWVGFHALCVVLLTPASGGRAADGR